MFFEKAVEEKNIADSDQVINSLKVDWGTISKFLPKSQNQFLEDDIELIRFTVKTYCEALLRNLKDRFPESEILFAFRIFDVKVSSQKLISFEQALP